MPETDLTEKLEARKGLFLATLEGVPALDPAKRFAASMAAGIVVLMEGDDGKPIVGCPEDRALTLLLTFSRATMASFKPAARAMLAGEKVPSFAEVVAEGLDVGIQSGTELMTEIATHHGSLTVAEAFIKHALMIAREEAQSLFRSMVEAQQATGANAGQTVEAAAEAFDDIARCLTALLPANAEV